MSGSTTNISEALVSARAVVSSSGEATRSKRRFLLSDGEPTEGDCNLEGLLQLAQEAREGGSVVTSFGIGEDIDQAVMKGIAESGHGSCFFLRGEVMRQTVEDAMESLQQTVATEAAIYLQAEAPAGRLLRIYRPLNVDDDVPEGHGSAFLGDLRSQSYKQTQVDVAVCFPSDGLDRANVPLVKYELRFKSSHDGMIHRQHGEVALQVGSYQTEAPEVLVADALQQLGPHETQMTALMNSGQSNQAMALHREVIQDLEGLEAQDSRGYVSAQLRRLRRVVHQLEQGRVSSRQASMMVGETMQRAMSGDLRHLNSPPASPTWGPREHADSPFGSPLFRILGETMRRSMSGDLRHLN